MTEKLTLTVNIAGDKYVASVEVTSGTLPGGVFYYRNLGTTSLGDFAGVVDLSQLTLYPSWTGTATPSFGAPYVRHHVAQAEFSTKEAISQWVGALKDDLTALRTALVDNPSKVTEIAF